MLRNRAHRAVQAQVAALRLQVQSSLDALASEEALLQLLNASDLPYPYDFTVGLRSLCSMVRLSAVELIEASFVERPQPGLIFVYSDRGVKRTHAGVVARQGFARGDKQRHPVTAPDN